MIRCAARRFCASQDIRFLEKDGVLSVQLTREKALNALNEPMLQALRDKLSQAKPDLVYVTGKGKAFCAGGMSSA